MKPKLFALVDCNNFFVSCERVFQPALRARPVVVLSSNDGCVIARSNEVKALGVAMGVPAFKCRELFARHQVRVFSSNFALYQDMSRRVFAVLSQFSPDIEQYSVDESFLELTRLPLPDLAAYGRAMRTRTEAWTGIPVTVGLGRSKTQAKAAAALAKKTPELGGVFSLAECTSGEVGELLSGLKTTELWGIGPQLARRLSLYGVTTAGELVAKDTAWLRRTFGVRLERLARELHGDSCLPLNSGPERSQSIIASRSFGEPVQDLAALSEAVASFTASAARKLRRQAAVARVVRVSIRTSSHRAGGYRGASARTLSLPSAYTPDLTAAALAALGECFRAGYLYKQAGIVLEEITPEAVLQLGLLDELDLEQVDSKKHRSQLLDSLNRRYGSGALRFAAEGTTGRWRTKKALKSPSFTTSWAELPRIMG